jgi:hypothetical protein
MTAADEMKAMKMPAGEENRGYCSGGATKPPSHLRICPHCEASFMHEPPTIMTSEDTSRVGELGEIDVGLRRPYNRMMVNAVNLLAASGKQTEEKLDPLVRIVKMQQRAKKG